MALTNGFVTTAGTTARDARQMELGRITRNQDNTPRPGQLYGDSGAVRSTSSMSVTLLGDTSWALTRGKSDGVVIITNDGDVQVALDPAPSANSRYDVIYLKQNDTEKGDANSQPVVGKMTGTAAASPTVPAVPSGALLLATVLVPAGSTATSASGVVITNVVKFTALNGAAIRYRSIGDMNADAANVIDGCQAYVKGAGYFFLRGNQWIRIDADTFHVVEGLVTTAMSSGTNLNLLVPTSATSTSYTSDPTIFPTRSDGIIGPIAVSGWYEVSANVAWASNSTGQRYVTICRTNNEAAPPIADLRSAAAASASSVNGYMFLAAGDFVKLFGWQSSGGALGYNYRLTARLIRMN